MTATVIIATAFGLSLDAFVISAASRRRNRYVMKWLGPKFGLVFGSVGFAAVIAGWLMPALAEQGTSNSLDLISGLVIYGIGLIWVCRNDRDEVAKHTNPIRLSRTIGSLIPIAVAANGDAVLAGALFACQGEPILGPALTIGLFGGSFAMFGYYLSGSAAAVCPPIVESSGGFVLMMLGTCAVYL